MADVAVSHQVIDRIEATTGGLCTAITRNGDRCRNPIFHSQTWTFGEDIAGEHIALMPTQDFERWKAGSCVTHYAIWQGRNAS